MTDVRPMLTAATTGATAAVKFLLARQADVSPTDTYFRWNALHDCVQGGDRPELVRVLLAAEVARNERIRSGEIRQPDGEAPPLCDLRNGRSKAGRTPADTVESMNGKPRPLTLALLESDEFAPVHPEPPPA